MRVVLDCNIIVSAARVADAFQEVIDSTDRGHEIVIVRASLAEHQALAGRHSQVSYREIMEFVVLETERLAIVVESGNVVLGIRGSDNEVYLAPAVSGGAVLIPATNSPSEQIIHRLDEPDGFRARTVRTRDDRPNGGNVLTRSTLGLIREKIHDAAPEFDGPLTVYGERSRLTPATLQREQIVFKQTPCDIQARA